MHRVVVTGLGLMSALGNSPAACFANLIAGKSGIRRLDTPNAQELASMLAAQVDVDPGAHFPRLRASMLDRTTVMALVAARQAFAESGIDVHEPEAFGVFWGTGSGGATTIETAYRGLWGNAPSRMKPSTVVMAMNNAAAAEISQEFGLQGPSLTYSTACSSSSVALGEAFHAIARGSIKFAVAGGADAMLTTGTLKAWQALQTLAREDENDPATSCRPFAADRSGFVIGEGAGAIILEDADHAMRRGATIYAEIVGFGVSSDAQHITKPSPQGQARAIASALKVAGLNATDIGYINAHGTATSVGDVSETQALKLALGDAAKHIPISSTKSMHGHVMGASGAIEFIVTLMALKQSVLPPTAHLFTPDPQCDLDYIPLVARGVKGFKAALSNSFAFGGNNAVLAVRSFDR